MNREQQVADIDLDTMREMYAQCYGELKAAMERDLHNLKYDLESLELNALGPYALETDSAKLRLELWNWKLAIIERCERMNIDPQVYLSGANNGPF